MPRGRHRPPDVLRGYYVNFLIGENMTPAQQVLANINNAVLSDAGIWGSVTPLAQIMLVKNSFVPNPGIQISDLTPAAFDGSDPIPVPLPPQTQVIDNNSGRLGVLMKEPIGGYKWVATTETDPEETIYGYAVVDTSNTAVYWTAVLPVPIVIRHVGNFVELSAILGYLRNDAYGDLPSV